MARWRARARALEAAAGAPAPAAALPEDVQNVLDLAPQVIADNHRLAEQVIELAREAADLERELQRLRSQAPARR
jgi:hypothetical protein